MPALPSSIALVHEWFTPRSVGGAEQVVRELDQLLHPQLFALVDGESRRPESWLAGRRIQTSFVQRLPWGRSHVQQYLPLLPLAIEQLDLSGYPLVISSSHLVAKGILTAPDQLHVSYVHTPVRYAWDQMHAYLAGSAVARGPLGPWVRWQLHQLRQWDVISSRRPNRLIANSRFTARRIQRCWGRPSQVLHPPVNVERFRWDLPREEYYLSVCRLVPYKRVDLVVQAFNRSGLPLIVVGEGPERRRLEAMAGPTVTFLGHRSTEQVNELMGRCRAYVYGGLEDFGIAAVEAMAAGAPVIALGQGGLLDSVRCLASGASQPTGLLFGQQTSTALVEALSFFEEGQLWKRLPAEEQQRWAAQFSPERFRDRLRVLLERYWDQHVEDQGNNRTALPFPLA
ncbi:glycosyltransferase [Synechococcus sp. CS-602]|uniref:glycosyltransferase n=1 Tax=Synechococcaceae TaxID=1890426 RepID=UPI0008FF4E4D|nr:MULTISPECIES: glycosyltransferase [Synechococcaceae]MCT4365610.1 glycosyltransferase [Candidatus Regnicoccus frigidus MAG-AL1]APD47398.1 glycosyl transferase family 1 [Synechococcus sp. SynAce01]MCT0202678.1 glycosyltransferase [Synechococcus sp. CS-603]MCT0203589.1 glycosyltransferase [Synechococcus sp. CS-602]MCT0246034.1 glycosyltransferase [Synechococcus sp. CS-601]